jgi:hypothetical protein
MSLKTFRKAFSPRRDFNPSSIKDLQELKFFKENNKWKTGCPFHIDDPYLEIPSMCDNKFTNYMLSKMK